MLYLILTIFLVQMICWFLGENNKKKLNPDELKVFKKVSFQDQYEYVFFFRVNCCCHF